MGERYEVTETAFLRGCAKRSTKLACYGTVVICHLENVTICETKHENLQTTGNNLGPARFSNIGESSIHDSPENRDNRDFESILDSLNRESCRPYYICGGPR